MKVLTAAADPHSRRANDFCFAEDGEIVVLNPSMVCDNPACGCDRTAMGVKSRKGTTTMRVSDLELTDDAITTLLQDYNDKTWAGRLGMDVMREWWSAAALIAENAPTGALLRVHADGADWVVTIEPAAARKPPTMNVLTITATDTLQITPTAGGESGIAAVIGCAALARVDLHHGVVLWFDAAHTDPRRRPNNGGGLLAEQLQRTGSRRDAHPRRHDRAHGNRSEHR